MIEEGKQRKFSFGISWIVLNTLCWGILYTLAIAAGWLVWEIHERSGYSIWSKLFSDEGARTYIAIILFGFSGGVIIGSLQQLLLGRTLIINRKYWVIATAAGIMLAMIIKFGFYPAYISSYYHSSPIVMYVYYLASGLMLGLAQWVVLRQNYQRSGWWILATTVALFLSASIPSLLFSRIHISYPMSPSANIYSTLIMLFLEGFCYGVATWLVLIYSIKKTVAAIDENIQVRPVP